jgi:hypothetical protein
MKFGLPIRQLISDAILVQFLLTIFRRVQESRAKPARLAILDHSRTPIDHSPMILMSCSLLFRQLPSLRRRCAIRTSLVEHFGDVVIETID